MTNEISDWTTVRGKVFDCTPVNVGTTHNFKWGPWKITIKENCGMSDEEVATVLHNLTKVPAGTAKAKIKDHFCREFNCNIDFTIDSFII